MPRCQCLRSQILTLRINEFSHRINEFEQAEQPNNNEFHFRYGLTIPATSPARTSRTCRSSHPISTASSSASCASSRSSARFSFSSLIFSTQETGSPSGELRELAQE